MLYFGRTGQLEGRTLMDDRKRILLIAVIGAAALAFLCLILPANVAYYYVLIMHPLTLLAGFIFALQVSTIYTGDLKKSFLFLSLFLLVYVPVNIQPLVQYLIPIMGNYGLLVLQILNYALLLASCFYTVKVIDVKRMNRYGWLFLALLTPLCLYIIYHSFQLVRGSNMNDAAAAIVGVLIPVIDMAVVLMLVPVLFLYLQYLKAQAQESITFTFIMVGLILNFFPVYIIEIFVSASSQIVNNTIMNAAYLFSYLLMAIGLYANRKYDDWGFKMIEKALR